MSARYTGVTDTMRALLMVQLTEVWHEPPDDRLSLAPCSPVPILDQLLQQRAAERVTPLQDHTLIRCNQGRSP